MLGARLFAVLVLGSRRGFVVLALAVVGFVVLRFVGGACVRGECWDGAWGRVRAPFAVCVLVLWRGGPSVCLEVVVPGAVPITVLSRSRMHAHWWLNVTVQFSDVRACTDTSVYGIWGLCTARTLMR